MELIFYAPMSSHCFAGFLHIGKRADKVSDISTLSWKRFSFTAYHSNRIKIWPFTAVFKPWNMCTKILFSFFNPAEILLYITASFLNLIVFTICFIIFHFKKWFYIIVQRTLISFQGNHIIEFFLQPIASIVTIIPFKSISSRSSGITVISFETVRYRVYPPMPRRCVYLFSVCEVRISNCFSVNCDNFKLIFFRRLCFEVVFCPFGKNAFKLLWIDVCKYPQNCICTGDTVFQFRKFSQSLNFIFCPKDYVFYIRMTAYKADDA